MNRNLSLAVIAVSLCAACAPAFAASAYPDAVVEYVMSVRKTINTTDMEGYLAVVKNPQGAVLVDVREADEFAEGHVPGAINIPRGLLEFVIYRRLGYPDKAVDTNQKIYLQCASGGRCTLAAESLKKIGFTNVVAAIFNLDDWKKKGYPMVK
jgi:rhodanese-related sulfurtransferase